MRRAALNGNAQRRHQEPSATPGEEARRSRALPGARARRPRRVLRRAPCGPRSPLPRLIALSVSVSSGSRFYGNIVAKLHRERAAREEARTNDKWLVDVRSQQECPRRAREHRAQKVQSEN